MSQAANEKGMEHFNKGMVHFKKQLWQDAYDCFFLAHQQTPKNSYYLELLGASAFMLGNLNLAMMHLGQALSCIKPNRELMVLSKYAAVCEKAGRFDECIKICTLILEKEPNNNAALLLLGAAHMAQFKLSKAATFFERARNLEPSNHSFYKSLLSCYQGLCQWQRAEEIYQNLIALSKQEMAAGKPASIGVYPAVFMNTAPNLIKQIAQSQNSPVFDAMQKQGLVFPERPKKKMGKRIKIGYFSTAFAHHATATLVQDMFAHHNPKKFEVFLYAVNVTKPDEYFAKIKASVEHFYELTAKTDREIATFIYEHDLDILIDLDGDISKNKASVLAMRPAPLQITWLGYAATSGAPWLDYIVADKVIIPPSHEQFYSEKVLRVKDSYQFNSFQNHTIKQAKRKDFGLPEDAFVFVCFNMSRKIDKESFEAWCAILQQVENSVLWLLMDDDDCFASIVAAAEAKNIGPERFIRADRTDFETHLSRFTCADLFLDTFYCNAHTTCTESLAAGVPVITKQGKNFAARVASSLLTAANMEACITTNTADYIAQAVRLASDKKALMKLKSHLKKNKETLPLFDQKKWVKNWEKMLSDCVKT